MAPLKILQFYMKMTENKYGSPKCNIINKILSFIESLHLLRIWTKRLKTNQSSFLTDTHIYLIRLVTYNILC